MLNRFDRQIYSLSNKKAGADVVFSAQNEDIPQVNPQLYKWLATINETSPPVPTIPQAKSGVNGDMRKFGIASAYKKKAAEQQALIMRDNPPQSNAQDVDADTTFINSTIPQDKSGVNEIPKTIQNFRIKKEVRRGRKAEGSNCPSWQDTTLDSDNSILTKQDIVKDNMRKMIQRRMTSKNRDYGRF